MSKMNKMPIVVRAATVVGNQVRNAQGESVGEIKDLVFDIESGRIVYAVLSYGGHLGIGDKLFAIPWQTLEYRPEKHQFVMDVEREQLEQAPGFDKHNWPNMADRRWQTDVYAHYEIEPFWEELGHK